VNRTSHLLEPKSLYPKIRRHSLAWTFSLRADDALRAATLLVALFFIILFLTYAAVRIAFPYELKWMEGFMLEHVRRILSDKPVYDKPSIEFVAALYQPLYYHVLAAWSWIFGLSFSSARVFSFLCTVACAIICGRAVHRELGDFQLSFFAAAIYLASYGKLGFFFDVARLDSFFTLLLIASCYSIIYHHGYPSRVITVTLIVAAFFTKQQSVLFLVPMLSGLVIRDRLDGVVVLLSSSLLILALFFMMDSNTNGWYSYYTLYVPSHKSGTFSMARCIEDFFRYVGLRWSVTIAIVAYAMSAMRSMSSKMLWYTMTVVGLFAGLLGIGNEGGDKNVLMQLAAFGAVGLMLCIASLRSVRLTYALLLLQFGLLAYNPFAHASNTPSEDMATRQRLWLETIRDIPGEKWIPFHGLVNDAIASRSYADLVGFDDVLLGKDQAALALRKEYIKTLASKRFALIVSDNRRPIPYYSITDSMLTPFVATCGNTMVYYHTPLPP
jgi:hypothetical protein